MIFHKFFIKNVRLGINNNWFIKRNFFIKNVSLVLNNSWFIERKVFYKNYIVSYITSKYIMYKNNLFNCD